MSPRPHLASPAMRYKILTVDDSKTVRIIVKKAFGLYECDILEASNGVEGLAVASKENPHLILLDVTMPVMDGIETITKLKSDSALKGIPVIMLTAEGGRESVLKIAKIGVRDYIIKPFKEDILIRKVGRIINLKPVNESPNKVKSIFDPANILVVEDKPAIFTQIQEGLRHTPWLAVGVASAAAAIDFCSKSPVDLIIVSLTLPDESAFNLFRVVRANAKTKYTPIFGLVVKTDVGTQQQAQLVGFNAIVTKPIDIVDLEAKMAKAMNLDTSQRYFVPADDIFLMKLPEVCSPVVFTEISGYLKPKISEAVDSGIDRAVFDLNEVKRLDMALIKLLLSAMQTCRDLAIQFSFVGSPALARESRAYEDTRNWEFHESIEAARAHLKTAPGLATAS